MLSVNPYLNFNGNTEEAFNFYKSVFGGEFIALQRFKDTPEGSKVSDKDKEKIMHISLPIGKGNILMATDAPESMGQEPLVFGNNFHLSLETETDAEADKIFKALAAGGKIKLPLQKMFWGAYFGMLQDKFGVQWMVSHNSQQN